MSEATRGFVDHRVQRYKFFRLGSDTVVDEAGLNKREEESRKHTHVYVSQHTFILSDVVYKLIHGQRWFPTFFEFVKKHEEEHANGSEQLQIHDCTIFHTQK